MENPDIVRLMNTLGLISSEGKKGSNTRTSQEVTYPSTTLAQARLTAEF